MASDTDQNTTTDQTDQTEESAVTKPRRRRASSKAAAPAAAAPASSTTTQSTDAAPADAADTASTPEPVEKADKPAKKAPRKRAAKKTAEAPAAPAAAAVGEPVSTDPDVAGEAAAPKVAKKSTTRKRTSKAGKATKAETVTAAEEVATEEVATEEAPLISDPDPADEVEDEETPAVPSFGLLFQPPEPTVTRRRRATSPSQAPSERVAQAHDAPTPESVESLAPPAAEQDDDNGRQGSAQAGDDADGEGGSRRRRRGGRGRRGRAQTDDEGGTDDSSDTADAGSKGAGSKDSGSKRAGSKDSGAKGTGSKDSGADTSEAKATGDSGEGGSAESSDEGDSGSSRRRRRRRRGAGGGEDDPPGTVTKVREPRSPRDEQPTAVKGSTRLEAKKQRRREGREAGRRRTIITEAEFLSRRESVDRVMVVRGRGDRTQIGVLEDGVLVEHYVSRETTASMAGNVYLGRVQNVLPSMEAAFVDIGKGRNAVLYAGEVNWDAAGLEGGQSRRIENALKSGDSVLVQVTKDPIGHKGARLTSQISLPGRYVVYVPEGSMTGISRKLPDTERARLKGILKEVVPDTAGVIVRTAAEGASEEELTADVERLTSAWAKIAKKAETAGAKKAGSGGSPVLLHGEPDLTVRVIRDVFTEDFSSLVVSGEKAWSEVSDYVQDVAPDLAPRLTRWTSEADVFASHRIDEQIAKAMDRKVWLPSGGSLVIDRTEAMTVVDVNTGKFIGSGGNLEETVTKNNLEAAEEIVRQLRLRDIGGIIVVDFIDMVLESNRDLVVRRLLECLGRDRTKHQVAEVTSLGLVQMTRKRVGSGLIEVFSEPCEHCNGSGVVVTTEPIDRSGSADQSSGPSGPAGSRSGRGRRGNGSGSGTSGSGGSGASQNGATDEAARTPSGPTAAQIAAAAHAAALRRVEPDDAAGAGHDAAVAVADAVADAVVSAVTGSDPEASGAPDSSALAVGGSDALDAPAIEAAAIENPAIESPAIGIPDVQPAAEPVAMPAVQPVADPVSTPVVEPVEPPARRARRKRGRVVAPAGPPRAVGEGDGPASAEGTPTEAQTS